MIIKGANLEEKEVVLKKLTEHDWHFDSEEINVIKLIENMYISIFNKKTEIRSMNVDEKGKIIISKNMINHSCNYGLDTLKNISKYGILASEWFGELESEREGCFCAFTSKMKGNDYNGGIGSLAEDDYSRLNIGLNVVLFLDDSNDIMKELLHLDYFEYEYIKSLGSFELNKIYTENELKILDFIEKISPSGKEMRKPYDSKTNYWSAIPGGIPPFLINGICIKKVIYSEEELDEINSLFPNAVIFNNEREIVREPLITQGNKRKQ